ncbi:hypothetical protein AKJ66_02445 [candidate division MSBL1 archaeon SCGC-AAA259E22]|uniref:Uncharacterized protein n=1 Tax=candidate division MSBL1 archaeon SCGC-AAA259E22 TaxID=1698265 RepID=A0A133UG87_9EURY|nr:hypothetical protein AKJ66_02445 [candidate division MSBL1 archaeon SCGC-AAA259E22]
MVGYKMDEEETDKAETFLREMNEDSIKFLWNFGGWLTFDYIGIDKKSECFLVDVTSTTTGVVGPLSDNEKSMAREALERDFLVLVPVVKFRLGWKIDMSFKEPYSPRDGIQTTLNKDRKR